MLSRYVSLNREKFEVLISEIRDKFDQEADASLGRG
jgi:hypothetical protein